MPLVQKISDTAVASVGCNCISIQDAYAEAYALEERAKAAKELAGDHTGGGIPVVVEAPTFSLPEYFSTADPSVSFTATSRALLQGATIASYELSVPALGISKKSFTSGNISFTVPTSTPNGSIVSVELVAVDNGGHRSAATVKSAPVYTLQITTPKITVPANNATVVIQDGALNVQASAFSVAKPLTDTHTATDWQLASNSNMSTIIQQALNSKDLVAHKFSGLSIKDGASSYLRVRFKGAKGGWSSYSTVSTFRCKNYITTPGKRTAYRNDANDATVLIINDNGTTVHLAVGDAVKRVKEKYDSAMYIMTSPMDGSEHWVNDTDNTIPNYSDFPKLQIPGITGNLTTTLAKTITDAQLNALYGTGKRDTNTSTKNTTELVKVAANAAAKACRNVQLGGTAASMPNIQLLVRIYCEADFLDSMDPTVAANAAKKLSGWTVGGAYFCWSSTEHNSTSAWAVNRYGTPEWQDKPTEYIVIPVVELSA